MTSQKEKCNDQPLFVIIKKTSTGYKFDNDIEYKGPFAKHTLRQRADIFHPSLIIDSEWGRDPKGSISQMITGEHGANTMNKLSPENRITSRGRFAGGVPHIALKNGKQVILTSKKTGNGASIAEIIQIVKNLSSQTGNIQIRGTPLEYKRILDYLQFMMVKKVSEDPSLHLGRPNNAYIMDKVREGESLQELFMGSLDPDENNNTIYKNAYFVSFDRMAAFAATIRNVPVIFCKKEVPASYYQINKTGDKLGNIKKIRQYIKDDLRTEKDIKIYENGNKSNKGRTVYLTYKNIPIITGSNKFTWFLDTRPGFFYKLTAKEMCKVLMYWIFYYPDVNGSRNTPNIHIIEAFLAIGDTFHDFGKEGKLWDKSNPKIFNNAKSRTENGISNKNIPNTKQQHKFLVNLIGIDIYKAVNQYNKNLLTTLSETNLRNKNSNTLKPINNKTKVAHFLFLIVNILGHSSTPFILKIEDYVRDIMIKIGQEQFKGIRGKELTENALNSNTKSRLNIQEKFCEELKRERACVVIDAISGSIPTCLKMYSVYHNVGILDTATGKQSWVLSWGDILYNKDKSLPACPEKKKSTKKTSKKKTSKKNVPKTVSKNNIRFQEKVKKQAEELQKMIRKKKENQKAKRNEEERQRIQKRNTNRKRQKIERDSRAKARGGVVNNKNNLSSNKPTAGKTPIASSSRAKTPTRKPNNTNKSVNLTKMFPSSKKPPVNVPARKPNNTNKSPSSKKAPVNVPIRKPNNTNKSVNLTKMFPSSKKVPATTPKRKLNNTSQRTPMQKPNSVSQRTRSKTPKLATPGTLIGQKRNKPNNNNATSK